MQISRQNSNRIQIHAVSLFTRQMKPHRFENAPLLTTVSNGHGLGRNLDRCRANRCNRIENDAVTNKPRSCKRYLICRVNSETASICTVQFKIVNLARSAALPYTITTWIFWRKRFRVNTYKPHRF